MSVTVNTLEQDIYVITEGDSVFVTTEPNDFAGQSAIQFQDEGVNIGNQGNISTINFTGSSITASVSGSTLTINVTASGGGGAVSSVSGTANQITVSPTTGATIVSLHSNVIFPGTWQIGTLGYSDTGILFSAQSSTNSYNQAIIQNTSNGANASTNWNVSNNQGTSTTNFGEFGINSSGFSGTGSFGVAGNVYLGSASTDLVIGTYSANAIRFVVNMAATDAFTISSSQNFTFNQLAQSSSWGRGILFTAGTFSALTTATEFNDIVFDLTANKTWVDGTVATQRDFWIKGRTYNKTTTSLVVTAGYTLWVDPPLAGTGVTGTLFAAGFGGKVQLTATSTLAGLNIGTSGASDPTTTVNFDIWATTSSLKTKIGGNAGIIPYSNSLSNNRLAMFSGSTGLITFSPFQATGSGGIGQVVQTNGQAIFQLIDVSLTSLSANTEFVTAAFGGLSGDTLSSASTSAAQWVAGTVPTQRFNYFKGRTLTGVSATAIFTNAYTLYVDTPVIGSNASGTVWAAGFNGNINIIGSVKFGGTNSTGAGSAALGANSPAVTNTAPYTWITALSSDGSTVFIPCWK